MKGCEQRLSSAGNVETPAPLPLCQTISPRSRRGTKTEATRLAIFAAAMKIAQAKGLQHVSLNAVASAIGLTRSGVAKHVGSVAELQQALIDLHRKVFCDEVFNVAISAEPGLPRLDALFEGWIAHADEMRAFILSLLLISQPQHDSIPSDRIQEHTHRSSIDWQRTLQQTVEQSVQHRHLRADTNPAQLTCEILQIMLGYLCVSHSPSAAHGKGAAHRAYATLLAAYKVGAP